jgi:DNA polymerase IV
MHVIRPPRCILHVDMDAFYASVEQRDNPELRGQPVIVGWTGNRGVVAAASYEVRKFGVRSALPMHAARRLCPHAICVRPRMARYKEVSQQVFAIFRSLTPLVEGLSLDEAYLDVTSIADSIPAAAYVARSIKEQILETTQLTASVGVAPNKLVAKIASDLHKPDGLSVVPVERINEVLDPLSVKPDGLSVVPVERINDVLDPLSVRRLPGLGRKTGSRVEALGIKTLSELRHAPDSLLWPVFGRYTQRVRDRATGIDDRAVDAEREDISISAEDTFDKDIADVDRLQAELARLAELTCSRMQRKQLVTGCINIKIRRHDFTTHTRQRSISPPTGEPKTIGNVARDLLAAWLNENPKARLRLLGVGVSHLTPADQLTLFTPPTPASLDSATP